MHFETAAFFFFFVCVSIESDGEKDLYLISRIKFWPFCSICNNSLQYYSARIHSTTHKTEH